MWFLHYSQLSWHKSKQCFPPPFRVSALLGGIEFIHSSAPLWGRSYNTEGPQPGSHRLNPLRRIQGWKANGAEQTSAKPRLVGTEPRNKRTSSSGGCSNRKVRERASWLLYTSAERLCCMRKGLYSKWTQQVNHPAPWQ